MSKIKRTVRTIRDKDSTAPRRKFLKQRRSIVQQPPKYRAKYVAAVTKAFQRVCEDEWHWYKFMPERGGKLRLALLVRPIGADVVMPTELRREYFDTRHEATTYVEERGGTCL